MQSGFFAMHSRMKYINRWSLMRNTRSENIAEHSNDVAAIANALAIIGNLRLGKSLNAERAAFLGLYHDMPEIITGDMPTPIKYHSKSIRDEFRAVEEDACKRLLSMLPADLRGEYESAFFCREGDEYLWLLVKAADKISALAKCLEEKNAGNRDFNKALESTLEAINGMAVPEAKIFMEEFTESYSLSLDEISK